MKKFIITDPCYIMPDINYEILGEEHNYEFVNYDEPIKCKKDKNETQEIEIYLVEGTPNGDGSYKFRGQEIGVDTGLLCIAFCEQGWEEQKFGATFEKLESARSNFENIISKF